MRLTIPQYSTLTYMIKLNARIVPRHPNEQHLPPEILVAGTERVPLVQNLPRVSLMKAGYISRPNRQSDWMITDKGRKAIEAYS